MNITRLVSTVVEEVVFVVSDVNKNAMSALLAAVKSRFPEIDVMLEDEAGVRKNDRAGCLIAFSFMSLEKDRIAEVIRDVRNANSGAVLVAGGPHASGSWEETLGMGFDYVVVGEGEDVLCDLVEMLPSGDLSEIRGLAYLKNGRPSFSGKSLPVDITTFLPVSEYFPKYTPVEITRGCPHGCKYCQTTYLFGPMRHRTVDQVAESARILVGNGWSEIRFVSPNFLAYCSEDGVKPNISAIEEILESVRSVDGVKKVFAGSFPSEVRPESVTSDALNLLKNYVDNDNIIIGMQSGSDRVLKSMNRGHSVEEARRAIRLILESGFKVNVDFIFGNPGETEEDIAQTLDEIEDLLDDTGVRIHAHTFMPLPGTPWEHETSGRLSKDLRSQLENYSRSGRLYGDWKEQEVASM